MEMIARVFEDFTGGLSVAGGLTAIALFLLAILALVLLIGWKVNRTSPQSIEGFLKVLEERYNEGEIPRKEYEDIKSEIKEPLRQIKNFMKIYK